MRETRTSGSVGVLGEQSPISTRREYVKCQDSSEGEAVSLVLGDLVNCLVTIASYFPEGVGHIAVSGGFAAGEGYEHSVEFVLQPTHPPGSREPMMFRY